MAQATEESKAIRAEMLEAASRHEAKQAQIQALHDGVARTLMDLRKDQEITMAQLEQETARSKRGEERIARDRAILDRARAALALAVTGVDEARGTVEETSSEHPRASSKPAKRSR